jgi:VWFA-related protein
MRRSLVCVLLSIVTFCVGGVAQSGPPGLSKPMDLPLTPGATTGNAPPDYTSGARRVEDEARVQFKSDTFPVRFPAVVTDRHGKAVANLSQNSFHVFEDGTEQKIVSFEEVVSSSDMLPAASQPAGPFNNLPPVVLQPRNFTVMVVDEVNAATLDQAEARKRLVSYLAANSDYDHATSLMLLTSKGLATICSLSADPKAVRQLLTSAGAEPKSSAETLATASDSDCNASLLQQFVIAGDAAASHLKPERALELTIQAFLETAWRIYGIPGKKSLVWITEGFPFALKTPSSLPGGTQSIIYERALAALHDADGSVYPIDPRALISAGNSSVPAARRPWLDNSTPEMLRSFAAMTGGRAYLDAKEIPDALKMASGDASAYYVLGYELSARDRKAEWRLLTVKVANPEYQVLSRSGFLVSNSVFDPELSRSSELDIAASSPVDSTGLPITAGFQNISGKGGKRKAEFTLVVRGDSVSFGERSNRFQLDVWTLAEKGDKQFAKLAQVVQGSLPADQLAMVKAHGVGYKNSLELPPGDYTVKFVVRDRLSGRVGSVSAPLVLK